ncbi:hypothetical protein NE237_002016 [Protea cynaroides]|uniref:SKP1 component POZ domain-containing protein n=1 Tax=Protea cynaroides TaxID=273540 RepID=A0A9Q0KUE4_9MAGN|nr:hypothetical protein NE237_002016 [Protea cynaroides]
MMNVMSSDGKIFCVDKAAVLLSISMKEAIFEYNSERVEAEENHQEMVMAVDIKSDLLAKMLEYCEKHSMKNNQEDMEKWDSGFVRGFDRETLEDLLSYSNYLGIHSLRVLLCKRISSLRRPRKVARRSKVGAAMISPLKKERTRVADMDLPIKKRRVAYACSEYSEEDGMEESTGENYVLGHS